MVRRAGLLGVATKEEDAACWLTGVWVLLPCPAADGFSAVLKGDGLITAEENEVEEEEEAAPLALVLLLMMLLPPMNAEPCIPCAPITALPALLP